MDTIIPSSHKTFQTQDGNTILEGDIFEISLAIGNLIAEYQLQHPEMQVGKVGLDNIKMYKALTPTFNELYGCNLSWNQLSDVVEKVESEIKEIKKKLTPSS